MKADETKPGIQKQQNFNPSCNVWKSLRCGSRGNCLTGTLDPDLIPTGDLCTGSWASMKRIEQPNRPALELKDGIEINGC